MIVGKVNRFASCNNSMLERAISKLVRGGPSYRGNNFGKFLHPFSP